MNSLIMYTSDDGQTRINLRADGELEANSVVKDSLTTQTKYKRHRPRSIRFYQCANPSKKPASKKPKP